MTKNEKIISNLETLFDNNFNKIKYASLGQWLDILKVENPDVFFINEQKFIKLYDKITLRKFKRFKKNKELNELYEKVIEMSLNETEIINRFSEDLKYSFGKIKKEINEIKGSKMQIILLTYNYEPYAWISGFGQGNYPILDKPEYFDFNFRDSFFEITGNIDYSFVWENFLNLEKYFEKADILDDISNTEFYNNIRNSYIFKTYLLLNKAIDLNKELIFGGLKIEKPLFIYGNEHDCEMINIYCYE